MLQSLADKLTSAWRRLIGAELGPDGAVGHPSIERPWLQDWDWVPKRSAGPGFSRQDYREAHARAAEVARLTLGDELWEQLQRDGFLEVPSRLYAAVTYRLRVGRRIEVCTAEGVRPPWPYPFLCINPTYPLPAEEFLAHLYLYIRDREEEIVRAAAPQPWDQHLGRTF